MEAVDNANLISNMRRGRVPSGDRFRALCDVLGLESDVGPPRAGRLLGEERLGVGVELAERALAANAPELDHVDKARPVVAVYGLLGVTCAAANAARVRSTPHGVLPTRNPEKPEVEGPGGVRGEGGRRR